MHGSTRLWCPAITPTVFRLSHHSRSTQLCEVPALVPKQHSLLVLWFEVSKGSRSVPLDRPTHCDATGYRQRRYVPIRQTVAIEI